MGKPLKNETGSKYGRWTVLRRANKNQGTAAAWVVRCVCGTEAEVVGTSLRSGTSTSCKSCSTRDSHTTHGKSRTLLYTTWCAIVKRTTNPKSKAFKNYGGRGIRICDAWRSSFEKFAQDMGAKPVGTSLERIDNDGPYSPENCVWATRAQQARNKRTNVTITHAGKTLCIADWAELLGIPSPTIYTRIKSGLTDVNLILSKENLLWTRKTRGPSVRL